MKKTVKVFLHYNTTSYSKCYEAWSMNMSSDKDFIFVAEKEVEFDIPDDFDPRSAQIKALEKKQTEAAAAFHALTIEIKRQIQELQALEMV